MNIKTTVANYVIKDLATLMRDVGHDATFLKGELIVTETDIKHLMDSIASLVKLKTILPSGWCLKILISLLQTDPTFLLTLIQRDAENDMHPVTVILQEFPSISLPFLDLLQQHAPLNHELTNVIFAPVLASPNQLEKMIDWDEASDFEFAHFKALFGLLRAYPLSAIINEYFVMNNRLLVKLFGFLSQALKTDPISILTEINLVLQVEDPDVLTLHLKNLLMTSDIIRILALSYREHPQFVYPWLQSVQTIQAYLVIFEDTALIEDLVTTVQLSIDENFLSGLKPFLKNILEPKSILDPIQHRIISHVLLMWPVYFIYAITLENDEKSGNKEDYYIHLQPLLQFIRDFPECIPCFKPHIDELDVEFWTSHIATSVDKIPTAITHCTDIVELAQVLGEKCLLPCIATLTTKHLLHIINSSIVDNEINPYRNLVRLTRLLPGLKPMLISAYQEPENVCYLIPFFWSVRNIGLFFDALSDGEKNVALNFRLPMVEENSIPSYFGVTDMFIDGIDSFPDLLLLNVKLGNQLASIVIKHLFNLRSTTMNHIIAGGNRTLDETVKINVGNYLLFVKKYPDCKDGLEKLIECPTFKSLMQQSFVHCLQNTPNDMLKMIATTMPQSMSFITKYFPSIIPNISNARRNQVGFSSQFFAAQHQGLASSSSSSSAFSPTVNPPDVEEPEAKRRKKQ